MRPEPRLLGTLAALLALALLAAFLPALEPPVLVLLALLVAGAALDAWLGGRGVDVRIARAVPAALALGRWSDVELRVDNRARRALDCDVYDHHPPRGSTAGLPQGLRADAGETVLLCYRFRPLRRGDAEFTRVELLVRSRWGLWRARRWVALPTRVRVFPDFRAVQQYAILAVEDALGPSGIRKRRKRGEGLELHQLREYREGDSLRQIDWKATSRRDHVISRQYEDERNQQVVFLLDCGWRMRAVDDGEAHFDHALNSVLLLTYVAVRQGDAVGLMTIAGEDRWLPPQKGPAALRRMLEAVYDLQSQRTHPDFVRAASTLMARQPRRALVVILSNLRDEDGDEVETAAQLMGRRHLVLFASLRETAIDAAVDATLTGFRAALRAAAARHYLMARRRAHERLRRRGLMTLDVTAAELPLAVVNRYYAIKRSGAL